MIPEKLTVAVFGLGRMGSGIAATLERCGHEVVAYDPAVEARGAGQPGTWRWVRSVAEAAEAADAIVLSLPGPDDVVTVVRQLGTQGGERKPCIDLSTISVAAAEKAAAEAQGRGYLYVASPVGGGPAQAAAGQLSLFPSLEPSEFSGVVKDVLDCLGTVRPLGSIQGAVGFKLICNMVGMTNVAVLCEAANLGRSLGIDLDVLGAALTAAGAGSHQLNIRWDSIAKEDYSVRFPVTLALKDLRLACGEAHANKVRAVMAGATCASLDEAQRQGLGDADVIAMAALSDGEGRTSAVDPDQSRMGLDG